MRSDQRYATPAPDALSAGARLLKGILQGVLRRLLGTGAAPARQGSSPIWAGIYQDFKDVAASGDGYAAVELLSETANFTSALRAGAVTNPSLPSHLTCEQTLLALHLASRTPRGRARRVLDFGDGMGIGYFALRSCLDRSIGIDYYVVENAAICIRGLELFGDEGSLHFCQDFPKSINAVDVVYVSSELQYVDDWRAVTTKLCAYGAPFVFFVKLSAGDIPTYTTAQLNLPGTVLPYRFLNIEELIGHMRDLGYDLVFRGLLDRIYEQTNFPETHRLGRACNLLFSLSKQADRS